jgi:hypothetical protein
MGLFSNAPRQAETDDKKMSLPRQLPRQTGTLRTDITIDECRILDSVEQDEAGKKRKCSFK